MTQLLFSLDQRTSSRTIVFDHSSQVRARAQKEFRQIFPRPRWVEHGTNEIWSTQGGVMREALSNAGIWALDLAAIGITNQRETVVVWDRHSGQSIHHAAIWQDRRTAGLCDQLREADKQSLFHEKTRLILDAYFSVTKLRWILDHLEGARQQAERGDLAFGPVDSWLVCNLT
ncbi:FGGY family carbohydrate kinase [Deinococcus marmoris]|uniref:FGGY family carbohydrate kinase n=1 Tax=Deinococcus marmoris TaxID=249408 RepID=UPI0004980530